MDNEKTSYYHVCSNGNKSKNFLTTREDFLAAFNRIGVCAANSSASVVAFSIQDSHFHILLYGTRSDCVRFKKMYVLGMTRYIQGCRGALYDIELDCGIYEITNASYLKNVAVYVINQPTKDGKRVMPYDYLWGTGCMYFRAPGYISVWRIDENGTIHEPRAISEMNARQKNQILHTHSKVPDNWLVCNNFLLPENYLRIDLFEEIYVTHNCYRVFMASSRSKDDAIEDRMVKENGILIETIEARKICTAICKRMYNKESSRWLTVDQRLRLAKELRRKYTLSMKQVSTLSRIPEEELRRYIR